MDPRGREAEPARLIVSDIVSIRPDRSLRYSARLSYKQRALRILYTGLLVAAGSGPIAAPTVSAQEGPDQANEHVINPNQFTDPMVAGVVTEAEVDTPAEDSPGLDNPQQVAITQEVIAEVNKFNGVLGGRMTNAYQDGDGSWNVVYENGILRKTSDGTLSFRPVVLELEVDLSSLGFITSPLQEVPSSGDPEADFRTSAEQFYIPWEVANLANQLRKVAETGPFISTGSSSRRSSIF